MVLCFGLFMQKGNQGLGCDHWVSSDTTKSDCLCIPPESSHGYSDLSFEQLAPLRKQLKDMESAEGIKSVKDFARKIKRERRERPKTVLRLNKSVYGIPDAGQSFSMFMQALHLKGKKDSLITSRRKVAN